MGDIWEHFGGIFWAFSRHLRDIFDDDVGVTMADDGFSEGSCSCTLQGVVDYCAAKHTSTDLETLTSCVETDGPTYAKASIKIAEAANGGVPLASFEHPERAIYLLGAEDHGLPPAIVRQCSHVVSLEAARTPSYNLAVAGSLVMYDRLSKRGGGSKRAVSKRGGKSRGAKEPDSLELQLRGEHETNCAAAAALCFATCFFSPAAATSPSISFFIVFVSSRIPHT